MKTLQLKATKRGLNVVDFVVKQINWDIKATQNETERETKQRKQIQIYLLYWNFR